MKIKTMIDYRGDCWTGFKDVSLRLLDLDIGETFSFICSFDQAVKIAKVIDFRKGQIVEKRQESDGIIFTVSKKDPLSGESG